jgi:hypothetical protein
LRRITTSNHVVEERSPLSTRSSRLMTAASSSSQIEEAAELLNGFATGNDP